MATVKNSAINKDVDTLVTLAGTEELSNKTLVTPTIASLTNAQHNHSNAAGGGTFDPANAFTGAVPATKGGTGQTTIAVGDLLVGTGVDTIGKLTKSTTIGDVIGITAGNAVGWITPPVSGGMAWSAPTGDTTAAINSGYLCNMAGLCTITLPATAALGSVVRVSNINTGGSWKLLAPASTTIRMGTQVTKVAGYIASTATYDAIEVVCTVANTGWQVISAMGNLTVETA